MVLWIALGIIAAGLGVLLVLMVELRAKQRRLQSAVAVGRQQLERASGIVEALQRIDPPRRPARSTRSTEAAAGG